jgi:hypothetical protein
MFFFMLAQTIINNSDTFLDSERWDLSQIGIDLELLMVEEKP